MSIAFDFYASPEPDEEGKTRYHARPVTHQTISTERIVYDIHKKCSLTEGDARGALVALSESLASFLSDGFRVHLEGLGYFQVTLSCPKDANPKKTRAQSIRLKSIKFRADKDLKSRLADTVLVRSTIKKHSARLSVQAIDKRLAAYFQKKQMLTRKDFESLCGMTKTTAQRHLGRLVQEGKIKNINTQHYPIYTAVEG